MDGVVVVRLPVRWGDMDALGHVNNTQFFRWFEESRIALFEVIGLQSSVGRGLGPILAHTACDFVQPVRWPETVEVTAHIARIGNTSFTMQHQVLRVSDGAVVARGTGVVVLVDYDSGSSQPIPTPMRDALQKLHRDAPPTGLIG